MSAVQAVIFDLDGVIVSTDEYHYQAWKQLADEEAIPFDHKDNERLRGVSRMESLAIILEKAAREYSDKQKFELAERKNGYYRQLLTKLTPADILPGVMRVLEELRSRNIRMAIGSSSKNAQPILKAIGLDNAFDVIVDGTHIKRSKPDPEVFSLGAQRMGIEPQHCLVVEDADAGVDAAIAADMFVLAVGSAQSHPGATIAAQDLEAISVDQMLNVEALSAR